MHHTIAAIATPPGESAIGIIRVSGPDSLTLVDDVFKSASTKKLSQHAQRMMVYGHIVDQEYTYDEVMVVYFKGPKSFTGEDMVEIFAHGSTLALREIINLLIRKGVSPADPGEFTKRAFLNGRLDLSQAEAIMDLISAKTKVGFDVAIQQLDGYLSNFLNHAIEVLTDLMAQIEVVIDYPDEDVEVITQDTILKTLKTLNLDLQETANSYDTGRVIKEGLSMVIIGRPNVGKSSLLNALLRESRAIVTHIPGTTRDVIEETSNIRGIPIKLIDTAGIRETDDMIEKIGVVKTKEFFNKSDMAILVFNASEALTNEDEHIIEIVKDKKLIIVVNKVDLDIQLDIEYLKIRLPNSTIVLTSLLQERGIKEVEDALEQVVISGQVNMKNGQLITNSRHYEAVCLALNHVQSSIKALESGMPLDLIEVDLANAYSAIGEITGKTVHEDVITRIFEKFCLGK